MENEKNKEVNWEKIGLYFAILGFVFMFWQAWRDLHKDSSEIKERVAKLEVKIEFVEDKK